jgi:hypothetical protein
MKHIIYTLLFALLFFSKNNSAHAQQANDTLATKEKLINTMWQVVKTDRLTKDKMEYKEMLPDANNPITYAFNNNDVCTVKSGKNTYNCTWLINNNSIVITENTEHHRFTFYVKKITIKNLVMVKNYKANQESFMHLTKLN